MINSNNKFNSKVPVIVEGGADRSDYGLFCEVKSNVQDALLKSQHRSSTIRDAVMIVNNVLASEDLGYYMITDLLDECGDEYDVISPRKNKFLVTYEDYKFIRVRANNRGPGDLIFSENEERYLSVEFSRRSDI